MNRLDDAKRAYKEFKRLFEQAQQPQSEADVQYAAVVLSNRAASAAAQGMSSHTEELEHAFSTILSKYPPKARVHVITDELTQRVTKAVESHGFTCNIIKDESFHPFIPTRPTELRISGWST